MCSKDRTLEENVEGAETLAYLLETDAELQCVAAISGHIIKTLAEYLNYTDIQQINLNGKRTVGEGSRVSMHASIITRNIFSLRNKYFQLGYACQVLY